MIAGSTGLHSAIFFAAVFQLVLVMAGVYLFSRYMRARRQRDRLRQEREVIFGFMHDVGEVFSGAESVSEDALLKRVLFYATRTSLGTSGAIYLYEGETDGLRARAVSGVFPPLTETIGGSLGAVESISQYIRQGVLSRTVLRGEGLIGRTADLGVPILIADAETDPRVPRHTPDLLRIRTVLLVPLRHQQKTLGVLAVVNRADGRAFTESDQSLLQTLADQASASIHYAGLRGLLAAQKQTDHDLQVARNIQSMLLPGELPKLPGFELAAFNKPAQQIGGDYYDVVRIDARHVGIAIADVAGKGIPGALMMTICRSVLRAQAPGNLSPSAVLRAMNRVIHADLSEERFVTMIYMVLDLDTSELAIARAGHEFPLLVAGDDVRRIESPGVGIGVMDDGAFDGILAETKVLLRPGDVFVVYTDGITDAQNVDDEEWGFERFAQTCREIAPEGARNLSTQIQKSLGNFVGAHQQYDDMTLLVVRKTG